MVKSQCRDRQLYKKNPHCRQRYIGKNTTVSLPTGNLFKVHKINALQDETKFTVKGKKKKKKNTKNTKNNQMVKG